MLIREHHTEHRYPELAAQLVSGGFGDETNKWEDVEDFGWLRAQHSPNWDVIPVESREVFEPATSPQ